MNEYWAGITTYSALGLACAALSVFVVLRRWAFIGEGIAHAGFGGAGTAWVLSLLIPGAVFGGATATYLIAACFCLAVALGIAALTRGQELHVDTVVGIFLVASLAWGFVAWGIYRQVTQHEPPGWTDYLIGRPVPPQFALGAVLLCAAILACVGAFGREILAYCFDPMLAQVSGVKVGFVHYLLILLVAITIIWGMPVVGSLLVTALLILPGATGLRLGRSMRAVVAVSLVAGLLACVVGPMLSHQWPFVYSGPAIVLVLVLEFLAAYACSRFRPKSVE